MLLHCCTHTRPCSRGIQMLSLAQTPHPRWSTLLVYHGAAQPTTAGPFCIPSPSPAPPGSMMDQFHQGIFPTSREADTPREHCLIPAVRAWDGEKRWGAAKDIKKN